MKNKLHHLNHKFIATRLKELNYTLKTFTRKFKNCYKLITGSTFNYPTWTREIYFGVQQKMYEGTLQILAITLQCAVADLIIQNKDYILFIEPTDDKPITKLNVKVIQKRIEKCQLTKLQFFHDFVVEYQKQFNMSPITELVDRLYDGKQKSLYTKTLPILSVILYCNKEELIYAEPAIQDSLVQDVKQLKLQFEEFMNKYAID
jgi:hypothetical protein